MTPEREAKLFEALRALRDRQDAHRAHDNWEINDADMHELLERTAPALAVLDEAGPGIEAPSVVAGYGVQHWHDSYHLLRDSILKHLDEFVIDDDVAEEAILCNAIELAAQRLRSSPKLKPEAPASIPDEATTTAVDSLAGVRQVLQQIRQENADVLAALIPYEAVSAFWAAYNDHPDNSIDASTRAGLEAYEAWKAGPR